MPATCVEIADVIADLVADGSATSEGLVDAPERAGVRPATLRVLEQLPNGPCHEMRYPCSHIPEVAIEPEPGPPALASEPS